MGTVWYDPERVAVLLARTTRAAESLASLRCSDPLASAAVRAVRRTGDHLSQRWLPLLREVRDLSALTSWGSPWSTSAPGAIVLPTADRADVTAILALGDADLLASVRASVDDLRDRRDGPAAVAAWTDLVLQLHALGVRTAGDRRRAAAAWRSLGPTGTAQLVDVLRSSVELARLGRLGDLDPGMATQSALPGLGMLLGAMARSSGAAREFVIEHSAPSDAVSAASTLVLDAVASTPGAFTPDLLSAVTAVQVHRLALVASLGVRDLDDLTARCTTLLEAVVGLPGALVDLLATDRAVVHLLGTTSVLDPGVVEQVLAAGLGSAPVSTGRMADGYRVLGNVVDVARGTELTTPARRGVALGLLPHLTELVEVDPDPSTVVRLADGPEQVEVGRYADLEALVGQLVDEPAAQLALGATTQAFLRQRALAGADAATRTIGDPASARAAVGRSLAGVATLLGLVDRATAEREQLHAYGHGLSVARTRTFFDGVSIGAGLVSGPLAAAGVRAVSSAVNTARSDTRPPTVPSTSARADVLVAFDVHVVALAVADPALRQALGIDDVPDETWRSLAERIDEWRDEPDPVRAAAIRDAILDDIDGTTLADVLFDVTHTSGVAAVELGSR